MKVRVVKPKDERHFLTQLDEIKSSKKKAISMLFEEIEQEARERDGFISQQLEHIQEMHENFLTMLDYEQVLENVARVLPQLGGGAAKESFHGGINLDVE